MNVFFLYYTSRLHTNRLLTSRARRSSWPIDALYTLLRRTCKRTLLHNWLFDDYFCYRLHSYLRRQLAPIEAPRCVRLFYIGLHYMNVSEENDFFLFIIITYGLFICFFFFISWSGGGKEEDFCLCGSGAVPLCTTCRINRTWLVYVFSELSNKLLTS